MVESCGAWTADLVSARFGQIRIVWLNYGQMDVGVYESEAAGHQATAARRLTVLKRFTTGCGRLLDAGCASGLFLNAARQAGWSVAGVEPSQALYSKALQTLGEDAEVYCSLLGEAPFPPASFDAITLWDVFEHVAHPVQFMRLCSTS